MTNEEEINYSGSGISEIISNSQKNLDAIAKLVKDRPGNTMNDLSKIINSPKIFEYFFIYTPSVSSLGYVLQELLRSNKVGVLRYKWYYRVNPNEAHELGYTPEDIQHMKIVFSKH